MMDKNAKFKELGRAKIGLNKSLVVSIRSDGFFSLAQQVHAETDNDNTISVFLKNTVMVYRDGLVAMRDLLDEVVANLPPEENVEEKPQIDPHV